MATTEDARAKIRAWRRDPVLFVTDNFWVTPDEWQHEALTLAGGDTNPKRRLCMKACTGPGKSAALAWLGWHRLACFASKGEHPKGAALSITADNLKDNLWAELAKWQSRSRFLSAAFRWTKEKIYANDHPETWFLSARSFAKDADSEAIGRALSGLHSQYPFILLDETGEMPASVGKAAMQIFTGNPADAAIIQAGNPTSTSGLLYESCTKTQDAWDIITITADPKDPKRTPRVSVEHAQEMIDAYGRDNPWVMATILGLFPPTGFNALLGPSDIEESVKRAYKPEHYRDAPVVLGGDVAREGDDQSVIARRQGCVLFPMRSMRIPDTTLVATQFALEFDQHSADAIFVDETGGYGAGVIDAMRQMRYWPIGIKFGGKPNDYRYYDKRSEMLFEACNWVKAGGCLPDDKELHEELLALTFSYQGDKFRVTPKDVIKKELGRSPDKADAFALTFAHPVAKDHSAAGRAERMGVHVRRPTLDNYDPYARVEQSNAVGYDPYGRM
jgi:phage terminase large subunit